MTFTAPSVSEVLKDQVYLGNLSAAQSPEVLQSFGITHILSVCPEPIPSSSSAIIPDQRPNEKHMTIAVQDSEYEDLLIHLPEACAFIERALNGKGGKRGRVLVHCVMGISRSTTVVAAFLMQTCGISVAEALQRIKAKRPQAHPNYGFIKQLDAFDKCHYMPTPQHEAYRAWKRKSERDVREYLDHVVDTIEVGKEKEKARVLMTSEFPSDTDQARSFLLDLGITHLLSIAPAEISIDATFTRLSEPIAKHKHVAVDSKGSPQEALVLSLPSVCEWVEQALKEDEQNTVLIHSLVESRACLVACAFLMKSNRQSAAQAFGAIQDALPLFNPTRNFTQNLELFQACKYHPTRDHPKVKEWIAKTSGTGASSGGSSSKRLSAGPDWANMLSETGYDLKAFGDALGAIQIRS